MSSTPTIDRALSRGFYVRGDPNVHLGPDVGLGLEGSPGWSTRCGRDWEHVAGTVQSRDGRPVAGVRWCLKCLRQAGLA